MLRPTSLKVKNLVLLAHFCIINLLADWLIRLDSTPDWLIQPHTTADWLTCLHTAGAANSLVGEEMLNL